MATVFLNQEEADSTLRLLRGLDPIEVEDDANNESGIKSYELGRQERIVRGRMSTLEIINERFARMLRIGIFEFMRKNPEIIVGQVKAQKYSEFIRNLAVPTTLNVISLNPLRGSGLVVIEPSLIFSIIDQMFGGSGHVQAKAETGAEFTETCQRIISKFMDVLLPKYAAAWAPVYNLAPEVIRFERQVQFANVTSDSGIVLSTTFNVEIGNGSGQVHICLPYASVEPIRELLYSGMQGDQMEPDYRWENSVRAKLSDATVDIVAVFSKTILSLSDFSNLEVGDVIPIDLEDTVELLVQDVPVYRGQYGDSNRHYSVKITEILQEPGV